MYNKYQIEGFKYWDLNDFNFEKSRHYQIQQHQFAVECFDENQPPQKLRFNTQYNTENTTPKNENVKNIGKYCFKKYHLKS